MRTDSDGHKAGARSVSSLFVNLEKLACERMPRSGQAALGARWSFALPRAPLLEELSEYSLPLNRVPFTEALAARTGLRIVEHGVERADALYEHLSAGSAAAVAVDSFLLPYRPAYGRVHSHRTILVRRGAHDGEVLIEDEWPPRYCGALPVRELERARHSAVPLERRLEPVFAGRPVSGEWFSVEFEPLAVSDVGEWGASLLRSLLEEATAEAADERGVYGIAAARRFRREVSEALAAGGEERFVRARAYSLLLRAELSSRVFFCALLRAAAGWVGEPELRREADTFYAGLRHIEAARDVLIKCLAFYREEYAEYVNERLSRWEREERRLAGRLSRLLAGLDSRQRLGARAEAAGGVLCRSLM